MTERSDAVSLERQSAAPTRVYAAMHAQEAIHVSSARARLAGQRLAAAQEPGQ